MSNVLNELLEVYNDFSAREYDTEPYTLDEIIKANEIGLMFTTYDLENINEYEIPVQYSYNINEQTYKAYIDDKLVEVENCPISKAIDEIRYSCFDDYLYYLGNLVRKEYGVQ